MFKKPLFVVIIIMLSVRGFSQSPNDSLYLYEQTKNRILVAQTNTNFLLNIAIDRIGSAMFRYNNESGGYRRAQQAQSTVVAGLRTEGINKFKRFVTSGYFDFSRTWQDSLAWTTKGTEVDEQPYYYTSIKAGAYERFKYELGGLVAYNIIENKFYIGVGLDYLYNSATRSVDPRPEVNTYRLLLKPEILYKTKSSTFGINALWGYGTEVTSIGYKNGMYQTGSSNYIDRKTFLVQGYGFVTDNQGSDPLRRLDKHYGIGASYSTSFNDYTLKASANYVTTLEDNFKVFSNSVRKNYLSYYDTEKLDVFLQLSKQNLKFEQQLTLNYNQKYGQDLNIIFYAINYKYNSKDFNLNYLIKHNQSSAFQKEFGLRLNYAGLQKDDLSSDHHINYTSIEPAVVGNFYFKLRNKDRFKAGFDISGRLPMEDYLSVPQNQIYYFTTGVVFPDYYYYNSKVLKTSFATNYITSNVFSKFKAGLSFNVDYFMADLPETISTVGHNKPDNRFARFQIGLNLYL